MAAVVVAFLKVCLVDSPLLSRGTVTCISMQDPKQAKKTYSIENKNSNNSATLSPMLHLSS